MKNGHIGYNAAALGIILDPVNNTQKIFNHRAKMNKLAAQGNWSKNLEI